MKLGGANLQLPPPPLRAALSLASFNKSLNSLLGIFSFSGC
jgi:hypothetical protein